MRDTNEPPVKSLEDVLATVHLCDSCIGRIFGTKTDGKEYALEGKKIREKLKDVSLVSSTECWLCEGLSCKQEQYISLVKQTLKDYDFSTFLIGLHVNREILEKEQSIMNETGNQEKETLKNYLTRCIGLALEKQLQKEVDFAAPDIMVIIDATFDVVTLQVKSLFIYGRYLKFKRGIPQTKWFCRSCHGKGCRNCHYSGKLYEQSVEELVAEPFLQQTKGLDEAFHGAGREDIDVRMLGTGRPFVLEIKHPQKRILDLPSIEAYINEKYKDVIEVHDLAYTPKETVARLKKARFSKVYRVNFEGIHPFDKEKLKKVALTLRGNTINQFTPTRVEFRRARMIRKRKVYDCRVENIEMNLATCIIEAESGTYIKELVTGDDGKTQPNISDLLGIPCTVRSLDVIEIKGE